MAAIAVNAVYSGSVTYTSSDGVSPTPISLGGTVDPSKSVVTVTIKSADNEGRDRRHTFTHTLSATQIAFTRDQSSFAKVLTIEWQVVEYSSGVSVQRGEVNRVGTSQAVNITAVSGTNSLINLNGIRTNQNDRICAWQSNAVFSTNVSGDDQISFSSQLSPTNGGHIDNWQIIEFDQDVSIQRGSLSLTGNTSSNITITSVEQAKTFLTSDGFSSSDTNSQRQRDAILNQLTSSTNLLISNSQSGTAKNFIFDWVVCELTGGQNVESGVSVMGATDTIQSPSVGILTNPSIAFLPQTSQMTQGSSPTDSVDAGARQMSLSLNGTSIDIERGLSGGTWNVYWAAVDWATAGGAGVITTPPIPSAESFGTSVITTGLVTISPVTVVSAEVVGSPVIQTGSSFITTVQIPTEELVGSPVVSPLDVQILPNTITTQEAFGLSEVIAGLVIIETDVIPTDESFGNTAVELTLKQIFPQEILSEVLVGNPILTGGDRIVIPIPDRITFNAVAEYLRTRSFKGSDNDVIKKWLISEGYIGQINDAMYNYWEDLDLDGCFNDKNDDWKKGA